jgi:hypothetical protein
MSMGSLYLEDWGSIALTDDTDSTVTYEQELYTVSFGLGSVFLAIHIPMRLCKQLGDLLAMT